MAEFSALLDPYDYNETALMGLLANQLEQRIRESPGHWWLWPALPCYGAIIMNKVVANLPLDDNHSHSQIVRRIPRYAQVLELGCGDGSMSRLIRERCEGHIIGVDHNPDIVWQAQRYCDYVFTEDLDDPHSLDALEGEKFDAITLGRCAGTFATPRRFAASSQALVAG